MKLFLLVGIVTLASLAGAVGGFFSINVGYWVHGPLQQSARYDGFGGAIRGLIEGVFAVCAGALVAGRGAWLAGGLVNRLTGGKPISGDRPVRIDFVILGVLLAWAYLIWASW